MNKRPNPFFPQQPAYPNPPLPPGPPPQQPQQYDYSAYWAAQTAQQQQSGLAQPIPQWTPPQPTTGPSGPSTQITQNQSSLYANYGYGGQQNFNWQRQTQQQQPRQPFPIPQAPIQPSYFPQQHQHPPPAQPGRMFPPPASQSFPQPPQPYRPQQPMFHQQQPPPPQHSPPHLPPAKRPRFEGPQGSTPPSGSIPTGGGQMMGRGGSNSIPANSFSGRGGGPQNGPGGRGAPRGRGGGIGGGPSIGMMRGGALNNAGMRGGRGGHGPGGRGGHGGGQSGGHRGGRSGWNHPNNHNRRGASGGGGRGRGQGYGHGSHTRDGGSMLRFGGGRDHGDRERPNKKEEVRQTLTDFRFVGLEIESLDWRWGDCGTSATKAEGEERFGSVDRANDEADAIGDPKLSLADGVEEIEFGSAIKEDSSKSTGDADTSVTITQLDSANNDPPEDSSKDSAASLAGPPPPSPPRIRIYFNTPATLDESQPRTQMNGPSNSHGTRAKRKIEEDEQEEGRRRRTKLNPVSENGDISLDPPTKSVEVERDRGSVAPSVDMSATASISGPPEDEGDWLMEAIGHDGEATREENNEGVPHPEGGEADAEGEDDPEVEFVDAGNIEEELVFPPGTAMNHADAAEEAHTDAKTPVHDEQSAAVEASTQQIVLLDAIDDPLLTEPSSQIEPDASSQEADAIVVTSVENVPAIAVAESGPDPEPPASPTSQTTSQQSMPQTLQTTLGSFDNNVSPSQSQATPLITPPRIPGLNIEDTKSNDQKLPSANRVSISYAAGARRLLIDAQIVETMKIWREPGRIEVVLSLEREGDSELKGLLGEAYSQATQTYTRLQLPAEDSLLPPWSRIVTPSKTTLTIYLDKEKPLSEPRWVKTGDVEEWLRNTFGIFWVSGEDGWEKRIEVVDPDPPPTIHTVLENWTSSSLVGLDAERQRFVKTHMSESENLLEILLRLVRGERATPISFSNAPSASNLHLTGPLLTAFSPSSPHASQQTHLTLAIVAMVRMAESFAERAAPGEEGKREVEERVGEIIRCLPQHLLYKSLDGIFREWKDAKKRGGRG